MSNATQPIKLTARDFIAFEETTGILATQIDFDNLPFKAAAGLVWILERKSNPELAFDEVLDYDLDTLNARGDEIREAVFGPGPLVDAEASKQDSPQSAPASD